MSKSPDRNHRQYTEGEQSESFLSRRLQAFAARSREPGDAITWIVVLGAVLCTLIIISYSVAGQPRYALGSAILTMIWFLVVNQYGRVNVAAILWGGSTQDATVPPNGRFVLGATVILTILASLGVVIDAVNGWNFRWYGIALIVVIGAILGIAFSYLQADRRT